ncbi:MULTISPECIES: helix-turn-helix transcriptional regulator [Bacillus]|uniref:helix-turn-helix transcriptional regulator n=1 Tax=Bacillus TaxID=1386 RepID=UPI00061AF2E2|nr:MULTISPECIES: helix-turn-helix transcriptional regulator [Bacillus]KKD42534.1 XRE family transcriptional regulator [Bacillus safensis]MCM3448873.1 helix-turn-helix domain-containing protein [Bacillus safensis]MDR6681570.1 transcriptional regulator with XRE-family HTH domain [Bacillus safensis]MEC0949734.1 helix-turn-helix transcriptional regulator [Bacillus safensis]MED5092614.1 helix-turn-helix transcriptional regulator [Bacillus safensis]
MNTRRREQFRKYRKQFQISQRQLSLALNVSESHIRNIESGRGNPDVKLLFKIANYFGTTAEDLFPDLAEERI